MPRMTHLTHLRSIMFALGWLGCATGISAAPLDLSSTPLFLNFNVESNVMFLIDDSRSMNWEVVTGDFNNDGRFTGTQPDGTSPVGAGQVKHRDNNDDGSADCGFGMGQSIYGYAYGVEFPTNAHPSPPLLNPSPPPMFLPGNNCHTADDAEWRFRNHDFNPMYFNPQQLYLPWRGVDANGSPFQPMNVLAAKDNPFDPGSRILDLTQHNSRGDGSTSDRDGDGQFDGFRYYTWTDGKVDGVVNGRFDDGEETVHFIHDEPADVQQNFANWFSYYRKREYVVKAVFGDVIANAANLRMGLATLSSCTNNPNDNAKIVDTPLQSVEFDASNPGQSNANPALGNRHTLLNALYSFRGLGGTPLRIALRCVGDYLENVGGRSLFPGHDAYLAEAQGGACQQSFVVLMTDGLDSTFFLPPGIGNADGDGNTTFDGGPYADANSQTLADFAMHYYERDLRSLPDMVPTTQVDQARHQHMVTYTVAFSGLDGSKDRDPAPGEAGGSFWPNPTLSDQYKIDDVHHAAFNGRGLFLQARDAASLADVLRRALNNIAQRVSSAASVTLNSGSLSSTSRLYQASFDSGTWSGQFLSIKLDPQTGVPVPQETIDSGALLDKILQDNGYNTNVRTILTYKPTTASGIPFQWPLLDTAQQLALHTDINGIVDSLGQDRLAFLRGSNAGEGPAPPVGKGKGFRERPHRLGDLINSDPYFVGPPALPDHVDPTGTYRTFREDPANQNRMPMIVVGGNDGLLHIFNANEPTTDANAGKEVLAYVPNATLKHTVALTSPLYKHRYYVDGSPTVGDTLLSSKGWRTVVVGGLRGGGQGYFALDITTPSAFSEAPAAAQNIVLWEFTDADNPDLGFTYSQPSIVRMANGQWAAVFGNGYNNSEPDGQTSTSTTGHAALFIVFLNGPGPGGTWREGVDYIKIDTDEGDVGTPNGLATPAVVDVNGDFTADYIVAGDLRGNLWQLDVTSSTPGDWKLVKLFEAGTAQPITSRPEVGAHPENRGGFIVYFGTGKYLEPVDNAPTGPTQTFYGIWSSNDPSVSLPVKRSELLQQTIIETSTITDADGKQRRARVTSNNRIDWQTQRGFFLDLPAPGERQVSDPVLRNGRILFTTLIPNDQPCEFGGTSFIMVLDVGDGARSDFPFFDLNADNLFNNNDTVSSSGLPPSGLESTVGIITGSPALQPSGATDILRASGSTGDIETETTNPGPSAVGRQAWRQITQ